MCTLLSSWSTFLLCLITRRIWVTNWTFFFKKYFIMEWLQCSVCLAQWVVVKILHELYFQFSKKLTSKFYLLSYGHSSVSVVHYFLSFGHHYLWDWYNFLWNNDDFVSRIGLHISLCHAVNLLSYRDYFFFPTAIIPSFIFINSSAMLWISYDIAHPNLWGSNSRTLFSKFAKCKTSLFRSYPKEAYFTCTQIISISQKVVLASQSIMPICEEMIN